MEDNDDWLVNNRTWKKWTELGEGGLLSYAEIDFHKPKDEEQTIKEIKRRKKLNNKKLEDNRRQAAPKRSIEYPEQLKRVENNKKWKEWADLKPGTKMTYKGRQYGEKDEHELMKAIPATGTSSQRAPRELPSPSLSEICVLISLSKKADKQSFLGTTRRF